MIIFWTNTIWYIALGILTLIQLTVVFTKTNNRKLVFALYCTIAGIIFTYEATILCFLKSYNYHPLLLQKNTMDDALAGNLFSQFLVSSTAILIAVVKLREVWYFLFAIIYVLIEELFLKLGIYEHYWYETWMTFVGLILMFWLVNIIYTSSLINIGPMLKRVYIFFGLYTLHMPIIFWVFKISGIIEPNMNLLRDQWHSYAFIALANLFFLSISCIIIYFTLSKWMLKIGAISILYLVLYMVDQTGILRVKEGWFLIFSTTNILGMYFFVYVLDKFYDSKRSKPLRL